MNKIEKVKLVRNEGILGVSENTLTARINGEDVKIYASSELNDDALIVSYRVMQSIIKGVALDSSEDMYELP